MSFISSLLVLFISAAFCFLGSWKLGNVIRKRGGQAKLDKVEKLYRKLQPFLSPRPESFNKFSSVFKFKTFNRSKSKKVSKSHD